jgi:hypothetical protein
MARIYHGATSTDLTHARHEVCDALQDMGYEVAIMERFHAAGDGCDRPRRLCDIRGSKTAH